MSNQTRPTLQQFRGELITDSVMRAEPHQRVQNGRRTSDNKLVVEELCKALGIINIREYTKEQNIRRILEREETVRFFTAEPVDQTVVNAEAAIAAPTDADCAVINAAEGLVIKKTAIDAPVAGFQPYAVRFTVVSEEQYRTLKRNLERASNEYRERRNSADWLIGALLTAIDAECGCVNGCESVASASTAEGGMVVQKVLLPQTGFKPFSLEFQLPTQALDRKFRAVMRYADRNFCSTKDWLFDPIAAVIGTL